MPPEPGLVPTRDSGIADPAPRARLHASCVALDGGGVLLRGSSGSGKSDLALRLIDGGGTLVADDQVVIERQGDLLFARAPAQLLGLLEVRGIGILRLDAVETTLRLVVDLDPAQTKPERLPGGRVDRLLGLALPAIRIDPRVPSAAAAVRVALAARRVA